jgi:hypothetical protein
MSVSVVVEPTGHLRHLFETPAACASRKAGLFLSPSVAEGTSRDGRLARASAETRSRNVLRVGEDATEAVAVDTAALREHETRIPSHLHKVVAHMMQMQFRELSAQYPAQGVVRIGIIVRIVENLTVDIRAASSSLGFDVGSGFALCVVVSL